MCKHKKLWCVILFLALVPLFSTASAGTSFVFRNGINWGTTVAGMLAAEGLQEGGGAYNNVPYGGYMNFYLKTQNVYYVFRDDLLVMAYAQLPGGAEAYAAQKEQQIALFGAPADVSADTVSALMDPMFPGTYFSELTTWRLDDGTLVALIAVNRENYMAYIHEQRILGGA